MKYPFNSPRLKDRRKELRNNATVAERCLWKYLKKSQLGGKFTRQHSVECFILDFYCPSKRLAIELDGNQHGKEENRKYDEERTYILKQRNIKVLRFWNREVFEDIGKVCKRIQEELRKR
jgi:very-short-patch-repair endonuclease